MHESSTRKPIYRPRNVIILLLLLLAGWLTVSVFRSINMRPNISVDYVAELQRLAAEHQAPGQDAWPAMQEIFRLREEIDAEIGPQFPEELEAFRGTLRWERLYSLPYDEAAMQPELLGVSRLRESEYAEYLQEIVDSPRGLMPLETDESETLIGILLPDLGWSRQAAKMLVGTAHTAARQGDFQEYVLAMEATLAIAQHIGSQPILICGLVGIAIESLAYGRIREDVIDMALPEKTCLAILGALDRWRTPGIALHLEGERMMFQDIVQRVYTDDGNGDGRFIVSALPGVLDAYGGASPRAMSGFGGFANLTSVFFPSRREMTEKYDSFINATASRAAIPVWERGAYPADPDADIDSLPRNWILIGLLAPALDRAAETHDLVEGQRQATRLMLALRVYEIRYGQLPEQLDALWPDILPEPVIDPINGKSFGYGLREPTDDDPRPYLLYSFGLDGTDDGGRMYAGDRNIMEPLRDASLSGYDYVYSDLRHEWEEE